MRDGSRCLQGVVELRSAGPSLGTSTYTCIPVRPLKNDETYQQLSVIQGELRERIRTLEQNVRTLSDTADALTKRINELEVEKKQNDEAK